MSKVLVDRELLELLRNLTFLHDAGFAGAIRGNIDKTLAAQPAEAEGVVIKIECTTCRGTGSLEFEGGAVVKDCAPCKGTGRDLKAERYALAARLAETIAALSAVTAERDGLAAARMAYANEFAPDENGDPDVGIVHANIRALKAERDRLADECERIALENDGHDQRRIRWAEELKQLRAEVERLREAFGECIQSLHDEMLQSYGGQKPDDMHPVTRRNYDRDMAEIAEYRAAMAAKEA